MVFYLALLPTILDIDHVGMIGWVELLGTMLLVLIAVDLAWALLAARARRFLASRRAVLIANLTGATVMAGAAATIAAN
jgi:threonine/homoserine/homoserine lactone efflux protein